MRKFVLSALALVFTLGLTLAGEVEFVKFDKEKKELTVKEGDKEATYKITDDTKVKRGDKDAKLDNVLKFFDERAKAGAKFDITTKDKAVTEIKLPGMKGPDRTADTLCSARRPTPPPDLLPRLLTGAPRDSHLSRTADTPPGSSPGVERVHPSLALLSRTPTGAARRRTAIPPSRSLERARRRALCAPGPHRQ
jgi:hypothetical protein